MIKLYKIEDLYDCYFGKDYDYFSFEVMGTRPLLLHLHTVDGEYITITDVDDIRTEAPRSDEYYELNAHARWGRLTKYGKKHLEELREENKVNDLKYQLKYQRFLWFLSSIRLVKGNIPFDADVKFVKANYHINMTVLEEV